jgi:predicted site-specific integrase-resolvase
MPALEKPKQVAGRLGVPESTLTYWRRSGQGPTFIRVGRQIRYAPEAVDDWLNSRTVAGSDQPARPATA